ncbi:MAG: DUF87 domain-containing protein [Bacteroidota bacterium]
MVNIPNHRLKHRPTSKKNNQLERLKKLFYEFTGLPEKEDDKAVNFGYTFPIDHHEFVIYLMDKWVDWKESVLDKLQEGTPAYADTFGQRGFKFGEYKLVISGKVKEQFYKDYRVFDYLFLTNHAERDYFTGINSRNEGEVKEGYIEAIGQTVKSEIPLLHQFLFKKKIPVNIKRSSLKNHSYLLGMSGAGKSTLIKSIIYNLQKESQKKRDKTIILFEPHGDLSSEVINFCLNRGNYKKRMLYLDPYIRESAMRLFDEDIIGGDYTFVINPFETKKETSNQTISYLTQELSSAVFEILKSEATNQMEAVIEASIEVLLRLGGTSISDLKLMMDDDKNEKLISHGMNCPNVEVARMMERIKKDGRLKSTKAAIYYRLQSLIGDMGFRRLLVGKSTLDLEHEINSGKMIVFNLSKSKMGKKSAPAFGKLLIGLLQGLAIKRQDIPEKKRMETYCFIDEFSNYVTPTIQDIMAEARKYRLYMILANQVISQNMERSTKRAILGNTALKLAGHNESDSIEVMARQMGNLKPERFNTLPKYSFYLYDKLNKKSGVHTLHVPDYLVHQKPPFFMKKEELKDLFKYMVFESGYYKKVEDEIAIPVPEPSPSGNPVLGTTSQEMVYSPNFEE